MHLKYSVINQTEIETVAPFEIDPYIADPFDPDADPLGHIIEIDEPGKFEGMVSPRQIDMIVDILADNGMY